jgi:WD40 repeat protein
MAADPLPKGAVLRMGSSRLTHSTWLTCVRFSTDDRSIAAADSDGLVRLWDVATGRLVWEKPQGTGRKLAFSPDGKTLAIGGYYNQVITLWDLEKDEEIRELSQNARSLAFSTDGKLLAAAGGDKIVRIWDPQSGKLIRQFAGHKAELYAVAFSADDRRLASAGGYGGNSKDNEIRLWDVATGEQLGIFTDDNQRLQELPDAIYSLAFSRDGKTIGACGPYVTRIWDVERRKVLHRLDKGSYDVAFSRVADRLVTCGDFGVYDPHSGEQLIKMAGHVSVYGCVAYSHDGNLIVSGNKEGYVQIWNAETGKEIVLRSGHDCGVRSVAFSPDGTVAASLSREDATIRVWGTASGKQLLKIPVTWRGQDVWWNEEGSDVWFAPYGRDIVTWTSDMHVRYWHVAVVERPRGEPHYSGAQ